MLAVAIRCTKQTCCALLSIHCQVVVPAAATIICGIVPGLIVDDILCMTCKLWPSDHSWTAELLQSTEHLNLNSGLFYLKSNYRTQALMKRIAARLSKEKAWDQSVYNQEIFFLSHDDYIAPHVSVRVMNIHKFMNSKVLFKEVRHKARNAQTPPVMIHMNYHPDKYERMLAAVKYYVDGDDQALASFPGGSEPGS